MTQHTITTCAGSFTGSLLECLYWQCEHQGAMPDIDGADISDIYVAHEHDPHREDSDLTPEQAAKIVEARLALI